MCLARSQRTLSGEIVGAGPGSVNASFPSSKWIVLAGPCGGDSSESSRRNLRRMAVLEGEAISSERLAEKRSGNGLINARECVGPRVSGHFRAKSHCGDSLLGGQPLQCAAWSGALCRRPANLPPDDHLSRSAIRATADCKSGFLISTVGLTKTVIQGLAPRAIGPREPIILVRTHFFRPICGMRGHFQRASCGFL